MHAIKLLYFSWTSVLGSHTHCVEGKTVRERVCTDLSLFDYLISDSRVVRILRGVGQLQRQRIFTDTPPK